MIAASAHMENMDQIYIGDFCAVHHGVVLVGQSAADIGIHLSPKATIREYANLNAYTGYILVGRNAYIGQGSIISGHGGVEIGDNTMVANLCSITASTHIFVDDSVPLRFQGETSWGIKIGANAWIAAGVTVLDGVTIGDHAVVTAGSVVTRDIPAWSIAGGVPARLLRDRRES